MTSDCVRQSVAKTVTLTFFSKTSTVRSFKLCMMIHFTDQLAPSYLFEWDWPTVKVTGIGKAKWQVTLFWKFVADWVKLCGSYLHERDAQNASFDLHFDKIFQSSQNDHHWPWHFHSGLWHGSKIPFCTLSSQVETLVEMLHIRMESWRHCFK